MKRNIPTAAQACEGSELPLLNPHSFCNLFLTLLLSICVSFTHSLGLSYLPFSPFLSLSRSLLSFFHSLSVFLVCPFFFSRSLSLPLSFSLCSNKSLPVRWGVLYFISIIRSPFSPLSVRALAVCVCVCASVCVCVRARIRISASDI